nr:DUF5979 domain-containing protein [Actinomyces bowdenii]
MSASVLAFFHSSAQAANNPRITISNMSLVVSSPTGEDDPSDTSVRVDDIVRLSFDWDARNAGASSGDSFRIGLPAQFRNREQITQDLKVSHGGQDVSIGQCALADQEITCTFNGELDRIKAQGFTALNGSGSALVVAASATDQGTAGIDANGSITQVPIPGGSIADNTGFDYEPERLRKWAFGVTNDSKAIDWELSFGTPGIQQLLQAQGTTLTVDGQTRSTITLTDEISPGQEYSTDKSEWKLGIGTSAGRNSIFGTVTDATGNDQNTAMGDYDMTVDINGNRATITITGPFVQDTNYHVYYPTVPTTADHTVQPGVVYTNNAALEGSAAQTTYSVYYVRSFNINVELKPGFGGFSATKLLGGPGAGLVPDGTTFELTVDYTLPGGATTDTYQGWDAPGQVNGTRTGGRTTLQLTAGQTATYNGTFPAGTVLTLSEDPATASSTPQGHVWGAPVLIIDDSTTSTLTIQDQRSTAVSVTNLVEEAPATTGSFSVTKRVEGDGDFSGSTFAFSYTCDNGTKGDLQVPGDGTVVTSPQITAGAVCEITEDTDAAAQPGFSLEPRLSTGSVTIKAGEVVPVTATNTYSNSTGGFAVTKTVSGAAGFAADTFEIDYVCTPPAGAGSPQRSTLRVTAGGPAVQGPILPAGTTCVISESEATRAREGHTVATTITVDGATSETVTIAKGATAQVAVANAYKPLVGSFEVTKTVTGDSAALAPDSFVFDYTCRDAGGEETVSGALSVAAGASESVGDVPVGECTITEADAPAEGAALATTMRVDGKEVEGRTATFTVTDGASVAVAATNTYSPLHGTFAVAKQVLDGIPEPVTGEPAAPAEPAAPTEPDPLEALRDKEFTFTYTCDDPGKATGTLKAKGDAVAVDSGLTLPVGTTCTITEDTASAQVEGYTLIAPEPWEVKIGEGSKVIAHFVNIYEKTEPKPTPSPSPEPSPEPSPSGTPSTTPTPAPSPEPSPSGTPSTTPTPAPSPEPSPSGTPSTTPVPGPAPSQDTTPGTPGPDPSPSHTCLTPAPSPSGTPGEPGADPSAPGTPGTGETGPAGSPSTDPCAPPASPEPGGSSLARTGASLGAVLVAIVGLVGGAAVLSHRRRI